MIIDQGALWGFGKEGGKENGRGGKETRRFHDLHLKLND